MNSPVPPKGSARSDERTSGTAPRNRALEALSDLASLAAGVCGSPCAIIHSGQGEDRRALAAFGDETGEDFPNQTVIPIQDPAGRALGSLTLMDREVTEVSAHQSRILSGLTRQAAALLELGGDLIPLAAPIEAQFHDILEMMPDPILMHAKGKVTFANAALLRLAGVKDSSSLIGKPIGALFSPESREAAESYVEDAYQKGLPTARRAFRYRRHDGKEFPLELASLAIRLGGEECRLVVARDVSPRLEAAETLRESEARFQTFMDHSPVMAFIKGPGNEFLYVNRHMQETFGLKPGTPDMAAYFGGQAGDIANAVDKTDRAVLEEGKALDYVEKLPTPDGVMRTWWVSKFPFQGRGGQRLIGGISLDITEKEKAEARIRVFADIFRNIQVGVFVWQLEGPLEQARFRLLATNAAAARMTSMSIDDVIGKTMQEAFPGVYDLGLAAKCMEVIADGESRDLGEIAYGDTRMPAGYYSAKIIPLPNDTVAVAFENVTAERRNREVLRQSVERFELIARATNDAVWEWKPATGGTWWNERLYQLFGLEPGAADPVGGAPVGGAPSMEAWKERLHPEDRARVLESFREIDEGGADTWVREYRVRRADGTYAHVYERGYALRDAKGAPERMLGAMLDITDRMRAEEAVRESEEKYRKLVEVLPDVIAIVVDGKLTFVNQAGLQVHGAKEASEVLGRPVLDFFHPDSRKVVIERLLQLDAGIAIPPMEHKFLRLDGTAFEAESRAITFPFQGHRAKLAVIRDITARKQAESALRASEERYRLLFLNNPQPMWLIDTENLRFLDVNQAAISRYGWSREEFLMLSLRDIRLPSEYHLLVEDMGELARNRSTSGVRRHRRKDGSVIHAEIHHHRIEFAGQSATLALANDITEKLEALERLRHSEERYRTLAAVSPVGLYRTDVQGRCTYANDHLTGLVGAAPGELIGGMGPLAIHPADKAWVEEAWRSAVARGLPFHAEYRMQTRAGRAIWVMGNALADKAPDGTTIGFVGTVSDITERKQAEILLACQKRTLAMVASGFQLQDVLDSLVQSVELESSSGMGAILLLDSSKGRVAWAAASGLPAAFRKEFPDFPVGGKGGVLGISASTRDLSICPDIESLPPEAGESWARCREAALRNGLRACASRPIIGSRGEPLGVFAFFYPQPGEPGGYDMKLMETASDLAAIAIERQRQEEVGRKNQELSEQNLRILEASRMKSEFLANMSHELRTPLNAIIGFSQLLIDRKVGPMNDKQSEYMGDILDGGMHLLRLINDVLDLAKIEAGKMQLHCEEISVTQAMREVCDILMPMAMQKGVVVRHAAEPGAEVAWLDGRKVRQVLYNLVSNAIKFSRNGGEVEVRSEPDDRGGILIKVRDQGIGIKAEDLGKLFQQFQQLDSGSARHYPGTGLGLVITKKLVELHQGAVEVESEAGVGSTFTAWFPYHRPGEE